MKYEDIKPYIEKRLISEQSHPEDENIRIFNYTQECQFSQAWDDITRQCRGLIMNIATGEIIARPFPKFFNYGEHVSKGWAIPTSRPIVQEKLDGSLGILYNLNGRPWIATRGSFTSDQAIWATEWWRKNVGDVILKDETNLFEIIYPQNRIVVSYDFAGLVHLATIQTSTGKTINRPWHDEIRTARLIPYTDMEALEKMDEPNSEGFVLFYPEENVRMKIKFPEYVRLHKIITGMSEIGIWEHLRDGKDIKELIKDVPDEFFKWVSDVATHLTFEYDNIAHDCERIFEQVKHLPTRKEQALAVQKFSPKYHGIVFALLDKKPGAVNAVWRLIRPHGAKPYKVDIDS